MPYTPHDATKMLDILVDYIAPPHGPGVFLLRLSGFPSDYTQAIFKNIIGPAFIRKEPAKDAWPPKYVPAAQPQSVLYHISLQEPDDSPDKSRRLAGKVKRFFKRKTKSSQHSSGADLGIQVTPGTLSAIKPLHGMIQRVRTGERTTSSKQSPIFSPFRGFLSSAVAVQSYISHTPRLVGGVPAAMGLCAKDFLTYFAAIKALYRPNPAAFWQEYKTVIKQLEEIRRNEPREYAAIQDGLLDFIIMEERGITGGKVGDIPAGVMEEDDDKAVAVKDGYGGPLRNAKAE